MNTDVPLAVRSGLYTWYEILTTPCPETGVVLMHMTAWPCEFDYISLSRRCLSMTVLVLSAMAECACLLLRGFVATHPPQVSWPLEWSCCGTSQSILALHVGYIAHR